MNRLLFMGTPEYASNILEYLLKIDEYEVVAVVTQRDKKVGRKQIVTPPSVKVVADKADIDVLQPVSLRDDEVAKKISRYRPNFIVVAAFGQILPKSVLSVAPCINLHASILPNYRGASPIQQSLLNGDKRTGVTAMLMNEGLDTGDILAISQIEIKSTDTMLTLYNSLTEVASELTHYVLQTFNSIEPLKQIDANATYCSKILKKDGETVFDNAVKIFNRYRAFTPWPGIFLKSGLKIKDMQLHEKNSKHQEGEIISILDDGVIIGCGVGSLKVIELQPPSKKAMNAINYLNGKRLNIGDTLL